MGIFDVGGSYSQTKKDASARSFVDPSQQPYLDFMRNMAQDITGGGYGDPLAAYASSLMPAAEGMAGGIGQAQQGLLNFSSPGLVDAQIGQLGSDLGALFSQQLLPAIGRQGVDVMGVGGGREAVMQGQAMGDVARAFTSGAVDIYGGAEERRLRGLESAVGAGTAGLEGMGQLFGLAQNPLLAQYLPLQLMQQIVGDPTVLDESMSRERTYSGEFSFGLG